MSHHSTDEAVCSEVARRFSALIDNELPESERLGTRRHLESCSACRTELGLLSEASSFLRAEGRSTPEPPAWDSVRRSVEPVRVSGSTWRTWLRFDRALAATLGLLVVGGLVFALVRGEVAVDTQKAGLVEEPYLNLAGLPGLESFLADHQAEEVDTAVLSQRLDFAPQVPEELPGGFRLQAAFVVSDFCCAGSCLIYRRGDELVMLVQHPPSHPVSWKGGDLEVEVVQIEPEGRNLTLVIRAGAVDSAVIVRALSGG